MNAAPAVAPPQDVQQLTGLILACYHHVFANLPARLRHNSAGAALAMSRALRAYHLRVDLRVQPLPVELRINRQALLLVVTRKQLREPHLGRVRARLDTEGWAAGLLISFETPRPTYRRLFPAAAGAALQGEDISLMKQPAVHEENPDVQGQEPR